MLHLEGKNFQPTVLWETLERKKLPEMGAAFCLLPSGVGRGWGGVGCGHHLNRDRAQEARMEGDSHAGNSNYSLFTFLQQGL